MTNNSSSTKEPHLFRTYIWTLLLPSTSWACFFIQEMCWWQCVTHVSATLLSHVGTICPLIELLLPHFACNIA